MPKYEAGLWPVDYGYGGCPVFSTADEDAEVAQLQADCEATAVHVLWNFTHRLLSTYETELRPERTDNFTAPSTFEGRGPLVNYPVGKALGWMPMLMPGGHVLKLKCGICNQDLCKCAPWNLALPGLPQEIVWVKIGEETVPEDEYWLDEGRLIRIGKDWPTKQNRRLPLGREGTWGIRYIHGQPVPRSGILAAGMLACELGKAAMGDSSCKLPDRVQTITRQGVTMAILDTFDDLEKGRVGIPKVDLWIQSTNVKRSAARLPFSPDYRSPTGR